MKRFLAACTVALVLLGTAACGDDDDDGGSGSGSASGSGSGSEAAAGDFCEIWPALNSDSEELSGEPTEEQLEEAREALDEVEAAAPEEIEDEVTQMTDAIGRLVDTLADGGDIDAEDVFGEVFALAFTAGPPIEEWLVDNCPDYEPQGGLDGSAMSGTPFDEDSFDGGLLGIPAADVADIFNAAVPDGHYGYSSSGDDESYGWEITIDGDADAAVAACESIAEAIADHPDLAGTFMLRIRQYVAADDPDTEEIELGFEEGPELVSNDAITAGDPGSCVAA